MSSSNYANLFNNNVETFTETNNDANMIPNVESEELFVMEETGNIYLFY